MAVTIIQCADLHFDSPFAGLDSPQKAEVRREELRQAREAGMIGIPCFVREDGSITLEAADVLKEAGLGC